MGDTIYRQEAIDAIYEHDFSNWCDKDEVSTILNDLPSAEPRWIPVTDRLPEYGEEVLTQDEFGDYSLNRIVDDETGEWFFEGVIAWRTLPEPFKEVGHR